MAHGEELARAKQARQLAKAQQESQALAGEMKGYGTGAMDIANRAARPGLQGADQYYLKSLGAAYDANKLPAMRSGWDTARRQAGRSMARMGMGQSGAAHAQQRDINNQWSQNIAEAQGQQARNYMGLASISGQGGINAGQLGLQGAAQNLAAQQAAAQLQLNPYQQNAQMFGQRADQAAAYDANKAAGEQAMWSQLAQAGIDVGAAYLTGGATLPASLAKYANSKPMPSEYQGR